MKQRTCTLVCSCVCTLTSGIFIYLYIFYKLYTSHTCICCRVKFVVIFLSLVVFQRFSKVYKIVVNYARKCYLLMIQIKRLRIGIMAWPLTCMFIVVHISVIQIRSRCEYLALHLKCSCRPFCKLLKGARVMKTRICSWMKLPVSVVQWLVLVSTYSTYRGFIFSCILYPYILFSHQFYFIKFQVINNLWYSSFYTEKQPTLIALERSYRFTSWHPPFLDKIKN